MAGRRRARRRGRRPRSGSGCRRGRRCRRPAPRGRRARRRCAARWPPRPARALLADVPRRLGGGVGGPQLGARQVLGQEALALRRGHRDREDDLDVGQRRARPAEQALLDVEHDLALDEQVVVEGQRVLREVDGALDRVLDGDEADVDLAVGSTASSTSGIVRQRHQLGRGQVGLAEERLLGERARAGRGSRPAGRRRSGGATPGRIVTWTPTPSASLLDGVAAGELDAGGGRGPAARGCPSPTSASPASTTTARCARACPRRSTARARRPSSAPPSWASCCTAATIRSC